MLSWNFLSCFIFIFIKYLNFFLNYLIFFLSIFCISYLRDLKKNTWYSFKLNLILLREVKSKICHDIYSPLSCYPIEHLTHLVLYLFRYTFRIHSTHPEWSFAVLIYLLSGDLQFDTTIIFGSPLSVSPACCLVCPISMRRSSAVPMPTRKSKRVRNHWDFFFSFFLCILIYFLDAIFEWSVNADGFSIVNWDC